MKQENPLVKFVKPEPREVSGAHFGKDKSVTDFLINRRRSGLWDFAEIRGVLSALDEMEKAGGPGAYVSLTLSKDTIKRLNEFHSFAYQDVGNLLRREVSRRSMPLKVKQRGSTFYMVWEGGAA